MIAAAGSGFWTFSVGGSACPGELLRARVPALTANSLSRSFLHRTAAFPGRIPTENRRRNICRRRPERAAHSLTMTMTAGWTSIWSTAASAISTRLIRRCAMRCIENNRDGTFTDVTEKAGVAAGGFGQGVAVGDYDRDGFPDLYVTQYGRSILYHNNGDGTFTDVTEKAGVGVTGGLRARSGSTTTTMGCWICLSASLSSSAKKTISRAAFMTTGDAITAFRRFIKPMPSWLFHNNGDGTFTDVSKASGIAAQPGQGLGRRGDGHQQRWAHGSVCDQRYGCRISCLSIRAKESSSRRARRPA